MNHTPEVHGPGWQLKPKVTCGWCASTHVADAGNCLCKEPCRDKDGNLIGWCLAGHTQEDPFAPRFL